MVGEMVKLFEFSSKTLWHYGKECLFKPYGEETQVLGIWFSRMD
jgi:hypothetical protein